jgi:hypothetical protein
MYRQALIDELSYCVDASQMCLCLAKASRDQQRASLAAISCLLVDSGLMALTASW